MNQIELSFRNERVFMLKNDIVGLTNRDWFLKNVVETDYIDDDNEDNKITINEDKNTAMSLLESMRYNRLIVYPRVSMDYLLLLAEKWCIPEEIVVMIKNRIENNINVNNLDYAIHEEPLYDEADNMVFKCCNCNSGFKMRENKKDSCICHRYFNSSIDKFSCCGEKAGSLPCTIEYHTLTPSDMKIYLNIKNMLKDK